MPTRPAIEDFTKAAVVATAVVMIIKGELSGWQGSCQIVDVSQLDGMKPREIAEIVLPHISSNVEVARSLYVGTLNPNCQARVDRVIANSPSLSREERQLRENLLRVRNKVERAKMVIGAADGVLRHREQGCCDVRR